MGTQLELDELLKRMVDALYLCIVIDADGTVRYISQAYAEIIGKAEAEIIGRPIHSIIPKSKLLDVVRTGKRMLGDIFIMNNGEATICNRFPILGDDGTVQGAFSTATFQNLDIVARLSGELEQLRREKVLYQKQLETLSHMPFDLHSVIGISPQILEIKQTIGMIANADLTVLLTGETGAGKEVFANAIHQMSNRKFGPYIKVNCAAIPKDLLEAELFGYAEGAFSGAVKGGKVGKFEQADHGTILLDEIGELPLQLQSKLLRVLQEREIERVGGVKTIKLDMRVICSTNQNLETMIAEGRFRRDLYYRINVVEMHIPPLRKRMEDLLPLCTFLIEKLNRSHGCITAGVSEEVLELFCQYDWPGNVRELEHVLERAAVMVPCGTLGVEHFKFFSPRVFQANPMRTSDALQDQKRKAEYEAIQNALISTNGNKTKAAQLLKIPRSLLYEKLKRYDIQFDALE